MNHVRKTQLTTCVGLFVFAFIGCDDAPHTNHSNGASPTRQTHLPRRKHPHATEATFEGVYQSPDATRRLIVVGDKATMTGTWNGDPFVFSGSCSIDRGVLSIQGEFGTQHAVIDYAFVGYKDGSDLILDDQRWKEVQ